MAANSRFAMAVHILSLLASRGRELQTSSALAASVNTNPVVVRRLLAELTRAGLVESVEGKAGGSRLARRPRAITLGDVYKALGDESLFALHQNPAKKSCKISCAVKPILKVVFSRAEAAACAELKKIDLESLLEELAV